MADATTKTFTVTAEAATAIGGTRRRKKRSTAKAETLKIGKQEGGTSPGTTLQVEANRPPGGGPVPSASFQKGTDGLLTKGPAESTPAPVQGGGPVKVILEKKKKSKVVLAPMKVKKLNPVAPASQAKTRKVAKKIRMSLNGFGKRVTRANTIRVDAKKQKLEEVKKTLVDAKLIKDSSKAPESMLRQMYADYMMLKNRAL